MEKPNTRRKDEQQLARLIERFIVKGARYNYRPLADKYGDYPERVKEARARTQLRAWTGPLIIASMHELYDSPWMKRGRHKKNFNHEIAVQLAEALNKDDGSEKNRDTIITLGSQLANDSMVGTSKFLHFCDPERFPINDRFTRKLTGTPGCGERDARARREAYYYDDYLRAVHLVRDSVAKLAIRWAKAVFGYEVTRVRAVEAFIFYHAKAWQEDVDAGGDSFLTLAPFLDHSRPETKAKRHAAPKKRRHRMCRTWLPSSQHSTRRA